MSETDIRNPGAMALVGQAETQAGLVPSMLVDVGLGELLLPGSVVAEIISWVTPRAYPDTPPAWLLGEFRWREMDLPLIAFQCFQRGVEPPEPGPASRIVVVKGLKHHRDLPYYGIAAEDIPRLAAARADTVRDAESDEPAPRTLPGRPVMLGGAPALIPDLMAVEAQMRAARPALPDGESAGEVTEQ